MSRRYFTSSSASVNIHFKMSRLFAPNIARKTSIYISNLHDDNFPHHIPIRALHQFSQRTLIRINSKSIESQSTNVDMPSATKCLFKALRNKVNETWQDAIHGRVRDTVGCEPLNPQELAELHARSEFYDREYERQRALDLAKAETNKPLPPLPHERQPAPASEAWSTTEPVNVRPSQSSTSTWQTRGESPGMDFSDFLNDSQMMTWEDDAAVRDKMHTRPPALVWERKKKKVEKKYRKMRLIENG